MPMSDYSARGGQQLGSSRSLPSLGTARSGQL
eukprot:SAG31_NODE_24235_length_486_cov_0.801034_1_plen_31_part_10